eukprot:Trichotokara_eunicae@DN6165_c0_g1_i3.p1
MDPSWSSKTYTDRVITNPTTHTTVSSSVATTIPTTTSATTFTRDHVQTLLPRRENEDYMSCFRLQDGLWSTCDGYVTHEELERPCGDSLDNPCKVASSSVFECGRCFKVALSRPKLEHSACNDGVCPPFVNELFVKVIHFSQASRMTMVSASWMQFCPKGCIGGSFCIVDDEKWCEEGGFPVEECAMSPQSINLLHIDC